MEGRILNNDQNNQDQQDHGSTEQPNRVAQKQRKSFSKRVIGGVIGILVALIVIIGFLGYRYFDNATQPLNKNNQQVVQVEIPFGANVRRLLIFCNLRKSSKAGLCLSIGPRHIICLIFMPAIIN